MSSRVSSILVNPCAPQIDIPSAASEDELRYALGLANLTTGKGKVRWRRFSRRS